MELDIAGSPVTVSCVHPGGVDTGIVDNARKAPGNEELAEGFKQALRMPPEKASRVILRGVARGKRRILVGADAWVLTGAQLVLGTRLQRLMAAGARRRLA